MLHDHYITVYWDATHKWDNFTFQKLFSVEGWTNDSEESNTELEQFSFLLSYHGPVQRAQFFNSVCVCASCLSSNRQVFLSLPVIQKYEAPLLHSSRLPRYLCSLEVCYVKSVCVCMCLCVCMCVCECRCVILCVLIFGTAVTNHLWGPKH